MYSQFADQNVIQQEFTRVPELERFAFEFCKAFKCKISQSDRTHFSGRAGVAVLTPEEIPVGYLYVDQKGARSKDDKPIPLYYYESALVSKERGSARANRNTRDSISIKSLISAVKKAGDMPNQINLLKELINGIRYAFGATIRDTHTPRIDLSYQEISALVLSHLEVDKSTIQLYDDDIKRKYKQFLVSQEKSMESMNTHARFCEGSYLIGYIRNDMTGVKPYYLVADVSAKQRPGRELSDFTFHTPLKLYLTLMDCPEVAPHVPIIAAWADGRNDKDPENDLKLPIADKYYPEVDVASGYSNRSQMWFLIPKRPA